MSKKKVKYKKKYSKVNVYLMDFGIVVKRWSYCCLYNYNDTKSFNESIKKLSKYCKIKYNVIDNFSFIVKNDLAKIKHFLKENNISKYNLISTINDISKIVSYIPKTQENKVMIKG